jgi:hypothetical protein
VSRGRRPRHLYIYRNPIDAFDLDDGLTLRVTLGSEHPLTMTVVDWRSRHSCYFRGQGSLSFDSTKDDSITGRPMQGAP